MSDKINNAAQKLFTRGRNISTYVEAGLIGFLPLIFFILELLSAYAEASLVEQTMPYFEGTFLKACIYTGVGMGAGIFFAPNFSWMLQCNTALKDIAGNIALSKEFKAHTTNKLKKARFRFATTALFTLLVAISSHLVTLYFMETAFNNSKTLEMLEIRHMGEVPLTLAISVSVMGFLLDILLGLTTSTRINMEDYYPSYDDRSTLVTSNRNFEGNLHKEAENLEKALEVRGEIESKVNTFKEKLADIQAGNIPASTSNSRSGSRRGSNRRSRNNGSRRNSSSNSGK